MANSNGPAQRGESDVERAEEEARTRAQSQFLAELLAAQKALAAHVDTRPERESRYRRSFDMSEGDRHAASENRLKLEEALGTPESMAKLAAAHKPLNLDIPESLDGEVQKFASGQISRGDFLKALQGERKHLTLGSADSARFENALADQVEQAAKHGVEVHAAVHLGNPTSEAAKKQAALWKPIENDFKKKTGIDPVEHRQEAIDAGYFDFARNAVNQSGHKEDFVKAGAAVALEYTDSSRQRVAAGEALSSVDGNGLAALVKSFAATGSLLADSHDPHPPERTPTAARQPSAGRSQH